MRRFSMSEPAVATEPKRNSPFVFIPNRRGLPQRVRPETVVCIEGHNGPRIYLMGGHSFETSNELTPEAVEAILFKE